MITSKQVIEMIKKQANNETPDGVRALNRIVDKIEVLEDIQSATSIRSNYRPQNTNKVFEEADKLFSK